MDLSFIETKTLFLIGHLLGIAFGAGGAFLSDLMFFKTVRDREVSKTEMEFLMLGSHAVMAGLALLILSGGGMLFLDLERYLASAKFLVKLTVVGVLMVNGVLFHLIHLPRLRELVAGTISQEQFSRYRFSVLASGVISLASWVAAIVLGAFKSIPYNYGMILATYVAVLASGVIIAFILRERLLPSITRSSSQ